MLPFILVAVIYLAVLVQATFPPVRMLLGVKPELVVCVIIYAAMSCKPLPMALLCLLAALMQGALSHAPLGLTGLPLVVFGLLLQGHREFFFRRRFLLHMMLGGIMTFLVCASGAFFILWAKTGGPTFTATTWKRIGVLCIINVLVTPLVFLALDSIARAIGEEPQRKSDE